jgi:hypothetical protein
MVAIMVRDENVLLNSCVALRKSNEGVMRLLRWGSCLLK